MDIQSFALALNNFKLQNPKSISSTQTLLRETKKLLAAFPEASVPLSTMIQNLETRLAKAAAQEAAVMPAAPSAPPQGGEQLTDFTKKLLPDSEKVTFDQVVGYADVKTRLCELILQPLLYPGIFGGGVKTGVVLYGPGGTGKSLFAKALAGEAKKGEKYLPTFFVTYADVGSKFYGEAEKNMRNLLNVAAKMADQAGGAIIFFDEGDALFGSQSDVGQSIVNEFKARHDFINKKNIATIVATNHPGKLQDTGLKRRLGEAIYVGIPQIQTVAPKVPYLCRNQVIPVLPNDMLAILQYYVRRTGDCGGVKKPMDVQIDLNDSTFKQFNQTAIQRFTGDNLRNWVERAATRNPLGRSDFMNLYYCPGPNDTWTPIKKSTGPLCKKYDDKTFTVKQQLRICWPPVTVQLLKEILAEGTIVPSTTVADIKEYLSYAEFLPDEFSIKRIREDLAKFQLPSEEVAPPTPVEKKSSSWFFSG